MNIIIEGVMVEIQEIPNIDSQSCRVLFRFSSNEQKFEITRARYLNSTTKVAGIVENLDGSKIDFSRLISLVSPHFTDLEFVGTIIRVIKRKELISSNKLSILIPNEHTRASAVKCRSFEITSAHLKEL